MTREEKLMRNAIRVVEVTDSSFYGEDVVYPGCTESDFPIEGILEAAKKLVPKERKIYAVQVCINGEMRFLGKKDGDDLSLYLFNAELVRTESWWEDKEGNMVTEPLERPDEYEEYDLIFDRTTGDEADFEEIKNLISENYHKDWDYSDTAYFKKERFYIIKEGSIA